MAGLTRKELKTDQVANTVSNVFEWTSEHRKEVVRWVGIAVVAVIAVVAAAAVVADVAVDALPITVPVSVPFSTLFAVIVTLLNCPTRAPAPI